MKQMHNRTVIGQSPKCFNFVFMLQNSKQGWCGWKFKDDVWKRENLTVERELPLLSQDYEFMEKFTAIRRLYNNFHGWLNQQRNLSRIYYWHKASLMAHQSSITKNSYQGKSKTRKIRRRTRRQSRKI